jgi:hypothetical protein
MFPSSQMAVNSMSWRVLRRARMNQGVCVDIDWAPLTDRILRPDIHISMNIAE